MEQIILGGYNNALSKTATEYNCLQGGFIWYSDARFATMVIPTGGTLSNLQIELSGVPGTNEYHFEVFVNGIGSGLECDVAAGATTGTDTGSIDVVAGDYVYIESTYPSGAPDNTPIARWSCKFTGSTANESIILGGAATSQTAVEYIGIQTGISRTTTESEQRQIIPTGGDLKKLYVLLSTDPGTAPDAYDTTLRVSGADSDDGGGNPLEVTIVADDTTGSDTTHTIPVTAGVDVDLEITPVNTPSASPRIYWGMVFVATIDGESLILGSSNDPPTNSQTEYNHPSPQAVLDWGTTEVFYGGQAHASNAVLKKFYVELQTAPGADPDKWTLTVRGGGGSTNLVVEITGAATTTGNDVVNTYTMADYDDLSIMAVPTDAPATDHIHWGLVCFIAAAAEGWAGGDVCGVAIAAIAKINGVALADIVRVNSVS